MSADDARYVFLARLVAVWATGFSLFTAARAVVFAALRVPSLRQVLADFETQLPAVTVTCFRMSWLPVALSAAAVLVGIAAIARPRRVMLVLAYVMALLSAGVLSVCELAAWQPFHHLLQSVSPG